MRRLSIVVATVAVAAIVVACSSGGGSASAAPTGTPAPSATLEGGRWTLTSYSVGGTMTDVPAGVHADATFTAGKVAGSAGCNGFSGSYTLSGSSLTFGPMASTQMACQPPADTVESAYLGNLAKTASYTLASDTLTLLDASGAKLLVFGAAKAGGLTGVTWHAIAYNNGKQAVQSVAAGSDPTAVFAADGTVSGNATCNTYNGPVKIEGSLIKIGPLMSTKMACASDELNAQEAAFLAALQATETYDIRGNRLELRDANTQLMAEFEQR